MDFMEYRLSKFKNDIANQFGHNVFYNNVLIRVFYYLLGKRINTRILFLMTTYRRVLENSFGFDQCSICWGVGVKPPLVPLTPPQVFIDPHWFSLKKNQKCIADPLWFYHKSSTGFDWGHAWM